MEDIGTLVSRRVVALRKQAGLSQDDLAAKAAMSRVFLSEVERGLKMPSLETLARLSRVLDVPVTAFLIDVKQERASRVSGPARLAQRIEVLAQEAPQDELDRFGQLAVAYFARFRPRRRRR